MDYLYQIVYVVKIAAFLEQLNDIFYSFLFSRYNVAIEKVPHSALSRRFVPIPGHPLLMNLYLS